MKDVKSPRARLEEMRDELRQRLSRLEVHVDGQADGADVVDGAQIVEQEDTATRGLEIVARELGQVEAALRRCDEGEWGRCIDCARPIAPARLRALPEATRCLGCQRKAESTTDSC